MYSFSSRTCRELAPGRGLAVCVAAVPLVLSLLVGSGCGRPKTYETHSLLRVRQGPGVLTDLPEKDFLSLRAQTALIKSPIVINQALTMPGVRQLPWIARHGSTGAEVGWLAERIEVQSIGESDSGLGELLQIGMQGDDPRQLEVLVNAVTMAYLDRVVGEERRLMMARRELLDQTYQAKMQEANRRRELVRALQQRVGTGDPGSARAKQQLDLEYSDQLRDEIIALRLERLRKDEALKQIKRHLAVATHDKENSARQTGSKVAPPELGKLEGELELLQSLTQRLETEHLELSKNMVDLGTSSEELERRKQDLATVVETTNKLAKELERYDLELRAPERVSLLEKAPVPTTPVKVKRKPK